MNVSIRYNHRIIQFKVNDFSALVVPDENRIGDFMLAVFPEAEKLKYQLIENVPQPIGFLTGKTLLSSEKTAQFLSSAEVFAPLMTAIYNVRNTLNYDSKILTLLLYFYLTDSSISVSLMAEWLQENGMNIDLAGDLSMAVYLSGIERNENPEAIEHFFKIRRHAEDNHSASHVQKISSVEDFFLSTAVSRPARLVFDDVAPYSVEAGSIEKLLYDCQGIPETSFLVEDHKHIILGMSNTLAEAKTLCLGASPTFYDFIRLNTRLAERTYVSLHSFLVENLHDFLEFLKTNRINCNLGVINRQFKTEYFNPDVFLHANQPFEVVNDHLPIFLNIEKV